jgi:hypothetical protein
MRYAVAASLLLLVSAVPAHAEISIGISVPGVQIGINMPVYPQLVAVPGYPVYYDPRASSNYFFYDGLYWVYEGDNWYESDWYNGPWRLVGPEYVPLFVLRVPVQYYRRPPPYFRGWAGDAPPRWGEHWGRSWEQRRSGWDRWDRGSAPSPAPLPAYQRQYSGDRYPRAEDQQRSIRQQNYSYAPREAVTKQHFQQQGGASEARTAPQQRAPAQAKSPTAQPVPAARPDRPGREAQSSRPTIQPEATQRPQTEARPGDRQTTTPSQGGGRDSKAASQGKGPQAAPAAQEKARHTAPPQQDKGRQAAPPVQEKGRQVAPAQQDKGRQAAPPAQEKGRQAAPPQQDKGRQAAPPAQEKARQAAPPQEDKGRENKKEDRGEGGR